MAYSTAVGPCASISGSCSRRSRTSASGAPSPCRTVTTKPSPTKTITSPSETRSLRGSYTTGFSTMKSESSYTSSFGRWCALRASSTARGWSPNSSLTRPNSSSLGSSTPSQTKASPEARAFASASVNSPARSVRRPAR